MTMLYPVVASSLNDWEQTRAAKNYSADRDILPLASQQASLEAAIEYNNRVGDLPLYDAWNGPENPVSPEYNDYLTQLSDGNAMGQLVIPTIDVNLPMYHGTDEETLEKGIGHLYGTSLPVGGQSTHSVLTGHTGIVSATILNRLDEVELGESIYIRTVGQDLKYEVSDIRVVLPEETDSLRIVEGEDLLTVITCTPYGINSHRLLVTGHRVPMDPNEAAVFEEAGSKLDWWMLVVAGAVIMVFIVIFVRSRKKSTRKFEQETIR
ncbi:hypothetical protein yhcS [Corynebacterium glutamicum]|nr:hypothetical protein yhcS [Corynebacterium glutamicum]